MNWRKLLLPFSIPYWFVTEVRNLLFNAKILPVKKFNKAIIIVGNLSLGGTGKSPHVMYILDLLRKNYQVAALSRGYGRKTSGFLVANYHSTAKQIGDEPMQFFNRFKNRILVAVGENRVEAIQQLFSKFTLDAIVLDDAFQHRSLDSDFKVLLTDYNHRYSNDWVLPAGNLRESKRNAKRAQIIIVTKCPENLSHQEKSDIFNELKIQENQYLFFSKIAYADNLLHHEYPLNLKDIAHYNVLVITGIAQPKPFIDYLKSHFQQVYDLNYPDHYNFKESDIQQIKKVFDEMKGDKIIITTEKDYMRLRSEYAIVDNLYYLPISVEIDKQTEFNQLIFNYVQRFQRSN